MTGPPKTRPLDLADTFNCYLGGNDYQTALAWLKANDAEDLEGLRLLARTIREPERFLQAVTEIALIAANTAAKDHFDGDVRAYLTWLARWLAWATQQEDTQQEDKKD
ncbi:MAG: hypothetical protein LBS56_10340 [Propionibacteriaceae bacterium]|jgi:hypothetical protein|nr:hypothetical protein [Propionibacteriaceae bacterium]